MKNPITAALRLLRIQRNAQSALDQFEDANRHPDVYERPSFWATALETLRALALDLPMSSTVQGVLQMKNWKTTLAGVAALLAVAAKVVNGHFDPALDGAAVMAGIGLIFAKDSNVTGGTVQQ